MNHFLKLDLVRRAVMVEVAVAVDRVPEAEVAREADLIHETEEAVKVCITVPHSKFDGNQH